MDTRGTKSLHPLDQLDAGMRYRLTLLVAPAGHGKTTLLREWMQACSWPMACVALVPEDNLPERFLADLALALQSVGVSVGVSVDVNVLPSSPIDLEDGIADVANALAERPDDLALILDNYHVIESRQIHAAMAIFLDYLPLHVHVFVASRTEPPLPLSRLRVRRQLLVVNAP
jgi:LuxR family maltose regulon positive regulatory protein